MDVIDLCEDEPMAKQTPRVPSVKITLKPNLSATIAQEPPRVPPIRLVNISTLKEVKVVRPEQPAQCQRQSRRKSIHHVKANTDANMHFIEPKTVSNAPVTRNRSLPNSKISPPKAIAHAHASSTQQPYVVRKSLPRSSSPRPNFELMSRVAFLRVCSEYMLKELGVHNVNFGENQSLEMLKAQYVQNKAKWKDGL